MTAEDLAELLACNRTFNSNSSKPAWKLLLSKSSSVLDEALELLTNKVLLSTAGHVCFLYLI